MPRPDLAARLSLRERPPGPRALHMRWENLLFLHWRWSAEEIQQTLPLGLTVDTYDGSAWLAIVPFFMRGVRPIGCPPVPGVSNFLELNVRTYVYDERGVPGVWFYSLLCNQPLAVETARHTFHLNYVHGRMQAATQVGGIGYATQRKNGREARFRYTVPPQGRPAEPGSLEFFLVERYVLFSVLPGGRILSGRVWHTPYEIAPSRVTEWTFAPARDDGFSDPGRAPDHIASARRLDVGAWLLSA